ncbi:hypothetical protein [Streptomyces sp. NPDC059850]|uniref:hypothetical protein n=1 Tax=Streptomyces sp. NPDC059850 TaxID=3346970 RepID=UPI003648D98D
MKDEFNGGGTVFKKTAAGAACVVAVLMTAGCGGASGGQAEGKASRQADSASPSPTATAKPLSADALGEALLTPEDMPAGWKVDEEHLDGTYQTDRQNLQGWKSPSASCNAFVARTNRAIGKPAAGVGRSLENDEFDSVETRITSYRDDLAAAQNISQLRKIPAACREGGKAAGAKMAFKRWAAPTAGEESVGIQMNAMGFPFNVVQIREGATVAELTFSPSSDTAFVEDVTQKAAARLKAAAQPSIQQD